MARSVPPLLGIVLLFISPFLCLGFRIKPPIPWIQGGAHITGTVDTAAADKNSWTIEEGFTPASLLQVQDKLSVEDRWKMAREQRNLAAEAVPPFTIEGLSLQSFWDMALARNSPASFRRFLETQGDSCVQESDWLETGVWGRKTRHLNYKHPVNMPMAPHTATARKFQTVEVFPDHGILLETKTFVSGVPISDCFHVVDRLLVEKGGVNSVIVKLQFEVNFVKSTIYKKLISKTTATEFRNLLQAYVEYLAGGTRERNFEFIMRLKGTGSKR